MPENQSDRLLFMTDIILDVKSCSGQQRTYRHYSECNQCDMEFSVFLPSSARDNHRVPALLYLSGLTCTWENAVTKAGAQAYGEELGLAIIFPDTSPRGDMVANDDAYDLGQGAGFYLNATQSPWDRHYNMQDYIIKELPVLFNQLDLPIYTDFFGITGHSMGGHGALTLAMKNPNLFVSLSAFAPIVNPIAVAWGQKAFTAYLGDDKILWQDYDACCLVEKYGYNNLILIDQGGDDNFLNDQLKPENFVNACQKKNVNVTVRMQEGYDHSYYFIASFIRDHIEFHAQQLYEKYDC